MTQHAFTGFPPDGLKFLLELEENNHKAWFDANKQRYQENILAHVPAFVTTLGERLQAEISPDIVYDARINGAGSMMRIYRDARFSQDKSPYKTNVGFVFWEGSRKKMENSSFGFQFGTFGAGLYAGMWGFPKDFVDAFRKAVDDEVQGKNLAAAIESLQAANAYKIEGESYARVPAGYAPEHLRAELLKYKGLHASSPQFDLEIVTSPDLVDVCFEHCKNMAPLQQWLARVDKTR